MRKQLALVAATALMMTGCSAPREHSAVDVTPPPIVEVPIQTVFHQAMTEAMPEAAIISAGLPAIDSLNNASSEIAQYAPEPAECAGTVDPEFYTTNDVVLGFFSQPEDDAEHAAETVVAASFETADEATAYFTARTEDWVDCPSVDLTVDDTNVLTLRYDAETFAAAEDLDIPEVLLAADQHLVLTSAGALSGDFEMPDTALPNPGALPDYVISPDDVPEPEIEDITISNATVVTRFDRQVFWVTIEPGADIAQAIDTMAQLVTAVQAEA